MCKRISSNRSKLENFAPKILSCAELIVLSIRNANIVSDGKASEFWIMSFLSQPLNSQLSIPNSQLYIINVLLFPNTAFSWPISISTLKVHVFLTFLPESFGDTEKKLYLCIRFRERTISQAKRETKEFEEGSKERVLWKDLHKQTSSTRSKSYIIYNAQTWVKYEPLILYKVKTSTIKEARSEQIQTNADFFGG